MRNKLLSSAAAVAVLFGVTAAYAQSPNQMRHDTGQAAQQGGHQAGAAVGNGSNAARGGERRAGGAARETTGQASSPNMPSASHAQRGQAQPNAAGEHRPSTNGSAASDEAQGTARSSEHGAATRTQGASSRATNGAANNARSTAEHENRGASSRSRESSRRGQGSAANASSNTNASGRARTGSGSAETNRSTRQRSNAASSSSRGGSASRETTGSGRETTGSNAGNANPSSNNNARGSASLNTQQQTRVSETITRSGHVNRVDRADFALSAGVEVPRHVRLAPLPQSIVEIAPEYRGYDYVMVNDEIVIVQPRTHRVVTVISERGGGSAHASRSSRLRFSQAQRESIRRDVIRERSTVGASPGDVDVRVGTILPPSVTLLEFPGDLDTDIPDLRPYRYVVIDDEVVVVNPADREIIDVIE